MSISSSLGTIPRPRKQMESSVTTIQQSDTLIGWQGIRFTLPPDWNLTSFSLESESGYLRVDSPGDSGLCAQVRWQTAGRNTRKIRTLYDILAPHARKLFRRPEPVVPPPDLKATLEKILKASKKEASKSKMTFESVIKSERTEGVAGERTAASFSFVGGGRGQGKIWHCKVCNRIVVAQIVGTQKDSRAIQAIASQFLGSLSCHSSTEYDLWALYDLNVEIPKTFKLNSQKVMSGNLQLSFMHGGEMIRVERWGLATMVLKKFTIEEWLRANAYINAGKALVQESACNEKHAGVESQLKVKLFDKIKLFKLARGFALPMASHYAGCMWLCPEEQKLFMVEVLTRKKNPELMHKVASSCNCHSGSSL